MSVYSLNLLPCSFFSHGCDCLCCLITYSGLFIKLLVFMSYVHGYSVDYIYIRHSIRPSSLVSSAFQCAIYSVSFIVKCMNKLYNIELAR